MTKGIKPYFSRSLVRGEPLTVREVGSEDHAAYNRGITGLNTTHLFQSYQWGELKARHGWKPIRLLVESGREPVGGLTLLHRSTYGLGLFYSPRGPVLNYRNPTLLASVLQAVRRLGHNLGVAFWKIDPEVTDTSTTRLLTRLGFRHLPPYGRFGGVQPRSVWRIPLYPPPGLQDLTTSARRQLRQAAKNGVMIQKEESGDLAPFYRLLRTTSNRQEFGVRGPRYYQNMWETLKPEMAVFMAYHDEEPIAGALVVPFGRGIYDLYAATADHKRDLGASYLLAWHLLTYYAGLGFQFYDLGGIEPEATAADPQYGLQYFKSRFGGARLDFIGEFDLVLQPAKYRLWQCAQSARAALTRRR